MVATLKLRAYMLQAGIGRTEVAKMLGISAYTLHKKIHNITEFKANEILLLSEMLNISDKDEVFFNKDSDNKSLE